MTDSFTKPAPDRRVLAIVLAIIAAGAIGYACVAKNWLYNPLNKAHMTVGFGLVSTYECDGPTCRDMSNSALLDEWRKQLADIEKRADLDPADPTQQAFAQKAAVELKAPSAFPILGWITLGCIALGALSLVVSAALVIAKKRINWPIMPTTTAILGCGIGLITGCVFVAMKPGAPGYVGVNKGFFAFGGGVVVGVAAALMLNKLLRPHDPDLLADTMDPEHY